VEVMKNLKIYKLDI